MLTRLALVAILSCAVVSGAVFDPYSRRYNVCKGNMNSLLTTPAGSSRCTLIDGFYGLTTKAALTAEQNTTFTTWVQSVETTIVMNGAYATPEAKLNKIAAAMEKLHLEKPDIYTKIQFLNISTWGPVDSVVQISKEWNFESSLELIVATSSSGNCKLFDLLLAGCAGDSAKHDALKAFIDSDLKAIVADKTKSQTDVIVEIKKKLYTSFFTGAQASWAAYFETLDLPGYFAFSQWKSVSITYEQKTEYSVVLEGQGMDCPFILSLNATLSSTSYSNTQKGFIKQLMNYFIQQWTTVVTVEERLNLISMKFSETCDLSYSYFAVLNGIQIKSFSGNFWNLIILSCQKPTLPPTCGCSVPVFTTTEAPAEVTTTLAASTTTEAMETTSEATTEAMETTEFSTEASTDVSGTSEFSTEATSDASTWESTMTFASSTPGCSCTCEY